VRSWRIVRTATGREIIRAATGSEIIRTATGREIIRTATGRERNPQVQDNRFLTGVKYSF